MQKGQIDKWLLFTTILLVVFGFIVFFSASLGVLAREGEPLFISIIRNQALFGVIAGFIFLFVTSQIPYTFWYKYSLYFFIASFLLTLLVFVPGLGFSHGGATRWMIIGPISFQPAELLKFGFVIYYATWATNVKKEIGTFKYGVVPLLSILGVVGLLLLSQPDTHTFLIIAAASLAMFIVAGGKWRYTFGFILGALLLSTVLFFVSSHIHARIMTLFHPDENLLGSGYQAHQSLIAIGSGGFWGRGLGQSIQKFSYLPEPVGDSIFAVLGEELGFWGGLVLTVLFVFFALRAFHVAKYSRDKFGRLITIGIAIMILAQAFMNIASSLGIFPLAGVPLTFVSHGGTALFIALGMVGVLFSVSKGTKIPPMKEQFFRRRHLS